MSGRKRVFPKKDLIELFHLFENSIVLEDGRVLKPSHKFWSELKVKHKIPNTAKAIYIDALKWHRQQQKPRTKSNDEVTHSDTFAELLETEIEMNSSNDTNECFELNKSDITFSVKLSPRNWETVKPIPRNYHRRAHKTHKSGQRTYLVLQPGTWTSLFAEEIAVHPKNIICNFAFDGGRVTEGGEHYINLSGKCTTCDAKLIGVLNKMPIKGDTINFEFLIKNFDESRHNGKKGVNSVRVNGFQARGLATSSKPAVVLHRNLSTKNGGMFEKPKGRVPTANAIRILQCRERSKARLSKDIFLSLQYSKESPKYVNTIHLIGMAPFSAIYGSSNQIRLFNTEVNITYKIQYSISMGIKNMEM